jgi:cytochrome c
MHFSLLEKLGAALLICAWVIYGANFLGDTLVSVDEGEMVASLGAPEPGAARDAQPAPATPEVPLAVLLAQATPADGEKVFGKCKACHTIEQGGANKVGPNLWGVVGGPKAHIQGFAYSNTLAGMGDNWTYEELDAFLANPKAVVPGTKMTFAGLGNAEDRAAVIAYMRANTENPPPLPEAPPPSVTAPEPAPAAEAGSNAKADADEPQVAAAPAATTSDAGGEDLASRLSQADAAAGAKAFGKCKSCHTVEQGGANKVGPNLWGVVGADKASKEGFAYSAALAGLEGSWTYEALDAYLADPKGFVPGNKMTFVGLKKPDERADVILYLRENSGNPPPLP